MFSKKGKVVASLLMLITAVLLPTILSAAQDKLDTATYTGFQQLRNKLSLTTCDLAAMGCNKAQTETILKILLAWYKANKASITGAEKATAEANIARCLTVVREAEAVVLPIPKISKHLKNKQPAVSARKNLKSE